jgi:nitric oxide reductase NorE protein
VAIVTERPAVAKTHLPGEVGVWMFIMGDLMMFGLLFSVFVYYRAEDVLLFSQSQATLNQALGLLNTLLMLSSSWFVALGMHAARKIPGRRAATMFVLALACGAGFILVKYFEYNEKIRAGITLVTNDFYMYYFMLTGIHLMHVVIGMGLLAYLWRTSRAGIFGLEKIGAMESCASFWHMVDILWVVLFGLLYLMR